MYAEELGRLCLAGEEIVDMISVQYTRGRERRTSDTNRVSFSLPEGLSVESWNERAGQLIIGLSLDLRRGEQAEELAQACKRGASFLALTSQRLLAVDRITGSDEFVVFWSADLATVERISHSPMWLFQWGRIRVSFTDGSTVRLMAGLVVPLATMRMAASFRRLRR